jgi:hypothetical protein
MDKIITAKSFTLRTESGQWLGQIVLTSDGMIAGVTDYGNLSYAWRSYGSDFEDFLLNINTGYFASKLESGMAYIAHNKTIQKGCERFSEMILPALQAEIKKQRLEAESDSPNLIEALKQMVRMYEEVQPAGGWQGVYEYAKIAIIKAAE